MTLLSRLKLFISIVWRDYDGSPLDWKTSWEVSCAAHPTALESALLDVKLWKGVSEIQCLMVGDRAKIILERDKEIVKLQARYEISCDVLDAALAKIDSLTSTQSLPEPEQVPFSVCCHQPWKRDKNHPIEWLTFRHTNGCPALPASPAPVQPPDITMEQLSEHMSGGAE
jgi:hypothetical protein